MKWLKRFFSFKWLKSSPKKTTDGATDPVPTIEPPISTSSSDTHEPFKYKINDAGIKLIAEFEGYKDRAYQCSAGVWTIGYGTTVYPSKNKVKRGDTCSEPEARRWFKGDIRTEREKPLNKYLKKINLELNENEFSALISFAYNLGMGWVSGYKGGSMHAAMEQHDKQAMAEAFLNFTRARGRVLRGLVRRRKAERKLFIKAV